MHIDMSAVPLAPGLRDAGVCKETWPCPPSLFWESMLI